MKLAPLWGDNKHKTWGHSLQDDLPTESRPFPTACNLRIMIEKRPGPCNGRRIPRVRGGRFMLHFARWMLVPAVVLGWLVAAGPVAAALTAEVRDEAGIFSKDAVERANREIKEIKRQFKEDLVVET